MQLVQGDPHLGEGLGDARGPWLFDLPFDGPMFGHTPDMPIHFDLHVWLYRHNPAGLLAMWNPAVECP